ncbi:MAG: hypothetical protein JXB26_11380 [Candidatus Aminicenantes bacterium]|nr:hypothetical protein [Candidatus Aminicenantes bacterium]
MNGQEEYEARLKAYKGESKNSPPIWEADRSADSAHEIFYRKGPVLLSELEKNIGTENFLSLCKKMLKNNIDNTSDFLEMLRKTEGDKIGSWFEDLLKTK